VQVNDVMLDIVLKHGFTAFAVYLMYLLMKNELRRLTDAIYDLKEEIKILRQIIIREIGGGNGS